MMMEPLSKRRRLLYLFSFILIFFALIPVVVLYSDGYHLGKGFMLEKTGGIYISARESGVSIYLDNILQKDTNTFSRGAYISDLSIGTYMIKATKDGRYEWTKTVKVFPQKVTEGYPFLIPQMIATSSVSATSTLYKNISQLFASSTHPTVFLKTATSSTSTSLSAIAKKNIDLVKEGNGVYAVWYANMSEIPFYFCGQDFDDSSCKAKLQIVNQSGIKSFDFYPGRLDVIIFSNTEGVFVTELDARNPQNTKPLMIGANLDFRVQNGQDVYVRNAKKAIYKLEL